MEIACFISPHGFGHAARASAVLGALSALIPDTPCHLFTTVPEQFFRQSLDNFTYHKTLVDVGLVQSSALQADITATIDKLSSLIPYSEQLLDTLAQTCADCRFILCDIAPLGVAVAHHAGVPSVLVENFGWDWIYKPYTEKYPQLADLSSYFRNITDLADIHIQTEPLCHREQCDLHCGPIFRKSRGTGEQLKKYLNPGNRPVVLITMGGVDEQVTFMDELKGRKDIFFVISGCEHTKRSAENVFEIDRQSTIYHPDLIQTADIVVCKAGYSTIAECYQAGVRAISVGRDDFAETEPLQNYFHRELNALCITPSAYFSGSWIDHIDKLLTISSPSPAEKNGADVIAAFLKRKLLS